MIRAYTSLNNLEYTTHRPIIANLVKHFATKYLNNPDIFVEYLPDANRFGDSMYDTDYSTQYNKQWLEVDYEINHDDSTMLTNNIRGNDGLILLRDNNINYSISSIPITHNFNVTIKIMDKFKNRLIRLLNSFKLGEINDTNYLILNADIFLTIPNNVIKLTKDICKLKYGNDDIWYKYLERYSTLDLDKLNSKSGNKQLLAYRVEYRDIAVWTEVGFLDKKIEREDKGFSLELTLKFSFDIITNLEVSYPILVCNKPLNKEYLIVSETLLKKYALPIERSLFVSEKINTIIDYLNTDLKKDVNNLLEHIDIEPYVKLINESPELKEYGDDIENIIDNSVDKFIEDMYNLNYNIKKTYPIYDVWRGFNKYDSYEPVGIMLLQIEPKSYTFFNLYELVNLGYNKEFIDYLIDNKDKFLILYKGFFHFNIYANNDYIPMKDLNIITEDTYISELELHLKRGDIVHQAAIDNNLENDDMLYIDMLKYYHFVLYILDDPKFIPDYTNEDITLLLQYLSMRRMNNLKDFLSTNDMKTVMQFSLLAYNLNGKSPIINQLLKDIMEG